MDCIAPINPGYEALTGMPLYAGTKNGAGYHQPLSGTLPTGFGSMDSTVSVSDKSGRHILQDFLRKALRLAANRLHDLCGRLDLQDANREEIETQVRISPAACRHVVSEHVVVCACVMSQWLRCWICVWHQLR